MTKQRVDRMLVERGLAESRNQAQRLVMSGRVWADDQQVHKASALLAAGVRLEVRAGPRYVSRGGAKLEAALTSFRITPAGWVCADVGASTGGFTDCLLQHGARKVYAIDVGRGQLHWKLRQHPAVVVMERTNARNLRELPEAVRLIAVDVSFISLRLILPSAVGWLEQGGHLLALVKPQFEAGPDQVQKGGVVRDPAVQREVLEEVIAAASEAGLRPHGLIRSPLLGPKGNTEFLLWLRGTPGSRQAAQLIDAALQVGAAS